VFRISLRELFALVAVVALAILSLKYASDAWVAIIAGMAMLALFAAFIVAAVDRGERQAFAIGFALIMVSYGLIVLNMPDPHDRNGGTLEFDHWSGRLPTTRLLRYVHQAVDRSQWIDTTTGQIIANHDSHGPTTSGQSSVSLNEIPRRDQFMPIGHLWWGILLGYIGGCFAQFVYMRRAQQRES